MKIVADKAIPFLESVFDPFAVVVRIEGSKISSDDVRDADALIVRTRTRCDAALLDGSAVRFIATATIGFDHIDPDDEKVMIAHQKAIMDKAGLKRN